MIRSIRSETFLRKFSSFLHSFRTSSLKTIENQKQNKTYKTLARCNTSPVDASHDTYTVRTTTYYNILGTGGCDSCDSLLLESIAASRRSCYGTCVIRVVLIMVVIVTLLRLYILQKMLLHNLYEKKFFTHKNCKRKK